MAKITKAKGLTISDARSAARVSGVVAAVADPETGDVEATHVEVPTGTAKAVAAWIGDDPARAAAASADARKGVKAAVARVLAGDDEDSDVG